MSAPRQAQVQRQTRETDIQLKLDLDRGPVLPDSGQGFFDHMLRSLAVYAGWGLETTARGDYAVDGHHTAEDLGLLLGQALAEALGDYDSHQRFGQALIPMDDSLAEAAVDLGRRAYLHFQVQWPQERTGDFELCLVEEFFRAFCQRAGATLHIIGRHGRNSHHLAEAVFKATGRALGQAAAPRKTGVLSTKGVL